MLKRGGDMKTLRHIGSIAFVLGLFTAVFVGIPWYVTVTDDPVAPWWFRSAVFCLLGGILVVLASALPLMSSTAPPGREVVEVLGLVQGHTVFAIWLGKDLSAIIRLILGGELTEYTEMMGGARAAATSRMIAQAAQMKADAIINVRYTTTSVVGSAAELLVYGTAVKLGE
jgi:uncharacterized protein YbjQ (UPF0145 family)